MGWALPMGGCVSSLNRQEEGTSEIWMVQEGLSQLKLGEIKGGKN